MALALLSSSAGAMDAAGRARVQVAIVRQAESSTLAPDGAVRVVLPDGRRRPLERKGELKLRPREGGLRLADLSIPTETRLEPLDGTTVKVGSDLHQGSLILRLDPGQTVTVVEEVGLEEYLEGVLPHEMDPEWPLEALKAQAVVARTFAYVNMGKFRKDGFDLTADTRSQVYRGLTAVNENIRAAVRQTRGEVLGWKGSILRVFYHSCCGGYTEDFARAWGGDPKQTPPPLRGVKDPWCRATPRARWTAFFSWPDLMSAIQERMSLAGPLTGLKIAHKDLSGYVLRFTARAGRSSVEVKSSDLRRALGAGELQSTKILKLVSKRTGIEFVGAGSGHGVGLCQWGARVQAEKGRSYDRILRFYFPGAELSEIAP
ncbi:MAG TPA: hypothetical protein DCZ01_05310 [Elusimicrobia bacterium]|nr:MAG: hypothetical protein A2X37_11500 [Elusimicrobia bacterium GWA2_66_18]HAZ07939.1 hypothetical protein [Elusimicrobiota bacterium]